MRALGYAEIPGEDLGSASVSLFSTKRGESVPARPSEAPRALTSRAAILRELRAVNRRILTGEAGRVYAPKIE
jgi:hypothetical protein